MDLATILGLVFGLGFMLFGILSGGSIALFVDIGSVLIVIGGGIGSTMIALPLKTVLQIPTYFKLALQAKEQPTSEVIALLVKFAERARREGILALEKQLEEVTDPFLRNGIQLAVDGTEPELLKDIMETELLYLEERHTSSRAVVEFMASMGPAWGMLGTLIGLVLMLANLDDPAALGPGMAVAIITTFYGSVISNLFCLPVANKLGLRHAEEKLVREMMIMGILSIQSGDNPRIVEQKLNSFMAPKDRKLKEER